MKNTIIGVVVAIIVAGLVWYGFSTKDSKISLGEGEPIKIGFIGALTGDAAAYGELMKNGITVAVEEINEAGGVDGHSLEIIYEDGKCDGAAAATAAQKLVNVDGVKYIVGMVCSGEVLGAAPIAEQNKVVILAQGSSPDISEAGKYIFRTWPNDTESGKILAEHASAAFPRVAVITEQTEYAVALAEIFKQDYEKADGQIVAEESFLPNTTDFKSQLAKIKATDPKAVFLNAQTGPTAALLAKQARDLGLTAQFYSSFFTGDDFVKANSAVEGTILVDTPVLDSTNEQATVFLEKYRVSFGQEPAYPFLAGASYDQIKLLAQAIEKAGLDTDDVSKYLYTVKSYDGTIGSFSFDETGDVEGINLTLKQVKDGNLVEVK